MIPCLHRYVTTGAGGGGTGRVASPWTITEAMTNAAVYRRSPSLITRVSNWAFVDDTGHGLEDGDRIYLRSPTGAAVLWNGIHQITKVTANQYKYPNTGPDEVGGFDDAKVRAHMAVWLKFGTYTLSSGLSPSGSGLLAENLKIYWIGYNTTTTEATLVSDMDYGETYYQSIRNAYVSGASNNSFVNIDANGGAFGIVTLNNIDGTIWKNINFHNNSQGSGLSAFIMTNTPVSVLLRHCVLSDVDACISGAVNDFTADDCLLFNAIARPISANGLGFYIYDCIIEGTANKPFYVPNAGDTWEVRYSVIINGRGIGIKGSGILMNNVFYNLTTYGMGLLEDTSSCKAYNNIFLMADKTHPGILLDAGSGGAGNGQGGLLLDNDYNCYWGVDGFALDNVVEDNAGAEGALPTIGENSIETDPLLVDIANADYRLRLGSPCLNTGRPTREGLLNIGAWNRRQGTPIRIQSIGV